MAEIKSTLDIIMEKTKGLTMTDEEKRELKRKEIAGKFKGLVQKFLDNIIDLERLKADAVAVGEGHEDMFRLVSIQEAIGRVEPESDNEPLLKILESTTGMDTGPIREFMTDFERKLEREKGVHGKRLLETLKKKGVSGSAVIPNLDADSQWLDHVSKLNEEFRKKVAGLVD